MNRDELQELADARVEDARALLAAGRWAGAYYLIGYAVECALKAAIAKKTKPHDFPDKAFVNEAWTHRPERLLHLAGREPPDLHTPLGKRWQRVRDWNEGSRYESRSESEARVLFEAVTDPANGVMQWIREFW